MMSRHTVTAASEELIGKGTYVLGQPVSREFQTAFEEEYFLRHPRRSVWWRYVGVSLVTAILTFGITWAFTASRPVSVSLAAPTITATPKVITASTSTTTASVAVSGNNSGQVALTEAQLKDEVRAVGESVYWAGSVANSLYTFNHVKSGQNFVRYLPGGKGLSDNVQNYRVIATYKDPNAFATVTAAAKISQGISMTNPDGSFIYYAKATPSHVYLVMKNLPYQIEIFDPVPGESLKLARTPGVIGSIL
ncbi:MAG: hypothetical protein NTX12_04300 [Actinobacteria bacterium]|nr:hypothetical protein [Actinomycetota bacterium]